MNTREVAEVAKFVLLVSVLPSASHRIPRVSSES